MARLYRLTDQAGAKVARWYVTEEEARLSGGGGASVEAHDYDEVELRRLATLWLNTSEVKRAAAIKREANKSAEQATAIANKVWATRRANGTDKKR